MSRGLGDVYKRQPTAGIYGSWQGENYNRTITSVNGSELNLNTGLKELFTENSYESAAITYQITSTGTWTYLTLVDSEGTATTYGGQDSGLKASGFGALTSFTYGTDYDLGDIVTVEKAKWNKVLNLRITELCEVYEYGGMYVVPTFGDALPTTINWDN